MKTTGLTENQVQQYRRDGYVVLPGLLDAITPEKIDQRIDKITEDAFGSDDYSQILEVEPETAGGDVARLAEAVDQPIRAKPAQFARLGGPPPYLPNVSEYTSLYQLQEDSKTVLADAK
jgi:hypothetical protein